MIGQIFDRIALLINDVQNAHADVLARHDERIEILKTRCDQLQQGQEGVLAFQQHALPALLNKRVREIIQEELNGAHESLVNLNGSIVRRGVH
jgi:hypothetical protein